MRSRRSVLRSTSALAAVGLAGCTVEVGNPDADPDAADGPGNASGDDDSSGEPGDGSGDGGGDPDATESLAELRSDLGELIGDMHEVVHDPDVVLGDRNLRQRVDEVQTRLEEIREEIGSEEQADQRRTLHELYRLLDTLLGSIEGVRDGSQTIAAAFEAIEQEDFEEVRRLSEEAREQLPRLGRVRDMFENVAPDIEEFDEIDVDELEATIDRTETVTEMMRGFHESMRIWSRGYEQFLSAASAYDDGNYRDAEREMNRAESIFSDAAEQLRTTRDNAPPDLQNGFEPLLCEFESSADAAYHYREAARAYLDGDEDTAATEQQQAEEALDRCE